VRAPAPIPQTSLRISLTPLLSPLGIPPSASPPPGRATFARNARIGRFAVGDDDEEDDDDDGNNGGKEDGGDVDLTGADAGADGTGGGDGQRGGRRKRGCRGFLSHIFPYLLGEL